ncbi:MAG: NAD-binding protein [Candidatus Bathyarchaeia archaeon]
MGAIGYGHTMKALNNFLSACSMLATSEALALATKAGLNPGKVIEVLQNSSGRSYSTDYKFPRYVLSRKFDDGFRMELQNKDLKIFTNLGRALDTPVFLGNMVQQIIGLATSMGYGEKGHTSIAEFMERWAGVRIKAETGEDED